MPDIPLHIVPSSIYDFVMDDIDGKSVSLKQYEGKVLLVVNVASKCGMTPQYAGLQRFYDAHKHEGFEILGFPSNDFGHQEPGTNQEIKRFCQQEFGISFPMFAKISVKGHTKHPLYGYLTDQMHHEIRWNFQKFLVDRKGKIVDSFAPALPVSHPEVSAAILQLLNS